MSSWIWGSSETAAAVEAPPADTRSMEEKLAAVKEAVDAATENYPFLPIVYKRFLNGHKGNVDGAIRGLTKHWEWRKEVNADTLPEESCASITAKNIAMTHGTDKEGRPVVNILVGRHDQYDRDINDMKNFIVFNLERLMKISNPETQRITMIFDMNGFGLRCMDYEVVQILIAILQKNYPEVLQVVLCVNSPFVFWACWAIIKPWIDPVTQRKIEFIDSSNVLNFVSSDQLHPDIKESLGINCSPLKLSSN